MKKFLNTLYITDTGLSLSKEGEPVRVRRKKQTLKTFPIHTLGAVVCFGPIWVSPPLMGFCAEKNVSITFLTENGRFMAQVRGPVHGNVLLRRRQYRSADDAKIALSIAGSVILGKLVNAGIFLRRMLRDHGERINAGAVKSAADEIAFYVKSCRTHSGLDQLRGLEGRAAGVYFNVFDHLILKQKKHFTFTKRSRRPPMDNVNAMLSFVYTLLLHDIRSALETEGLDPAVGFLHKDRPGRPSLALDLMEEFRPSLADRLVLTLINQGQVNATGFQKQETGGVKMKEKARKTLITAYQNRKRDILTHDFLNEKMEIGLLFHVQARLLARFLRGDLEGYPPFVWR